MTVEFCRPPGGFIEICPKTLSRLIPETPSRSQMDQPLALSHQADPLAKGILSAKMPCPSGKMDITPCMLENLDREIARVSAQLNKLREQKLQALKRQLKAMEVGPHSTPESKRTYLKFSESEVNERLTHAVESAGESGISAIKAAESTGIPYPRARASMPKIFIRKGKGGQTLYFLKLKKKG